MREALPGNERPTLMLKVGGLRLTGAAAAAGRQWSGAITEKVGHVLVRSGPYRWVRHPVYSAMIGMVVGTTLVSGETHALVALALIGFAYWRKIRLEERHLGQVFGADFDDYRQRSSALIPGLF